MRGEASTSGESSSSLQPQATLRKKQTARRSIKIYGELDETLQLLPFEEELQQWREAIQHDRLLQARGEEIQLIDPISAPIVQKCLRKQAPSIFIELSKEK